MVPVAWMIERLLPSGPMRSRGLLAVAMAATAAALAAAAPTSASPVRVTSPIDPAKGFDNIRHIVIVVQENRSFDQYFGTFPGANGIPRNRDGTFEPCIPDPDAGTCRKPYHDTNFFDRGAAHSKRASDLDVNGGAMDGFITVQEHLHNICADDPTRAECVAAAPGPNGQPDVMGYHTADEIPNYWRYATTFLLQDRMFAPTDSWTQPSHLYLVSGWSASCPDPNDVMTCQTDLGHPDQGWTPAAGGPGPYLWADITWLLENHGIDWAYYVGPGTCVQAPCPTDGLSTSFLLNPLPGFRTVSATDSLDRIRAYDDFFARAASGTLPQVSWIVPVGVRSEHPPHNLRRGQAWVTKVLNAIMTGPRRQWMRTAIFLTWDDWGGFYDHVPPIPIDDGGYGIRVPGIVISPWVKRGLDVDHQTLSFDAYLKLIEDRFLGGQRLDGQNEGWPDPRPTIREDVPVLGDLRNEFNFSQQPIPPLVLDPSPRR
jgi:phospholipase C